MINNNNTNKWLVERYDTQQELIKTLVDGLDRALTYHEITVLHWIVDCNYEIRGIILDLFKELVNKNNI